MSRILRGNKLWKSVDNYLAPGEAEKHGERRSVPSFRGEPGTVPDALRACSACAGDYEDPDRTAPDSAPEDDEELPEESPSE